MTEDQKGIWITFAFLLLPSLYLIYFSIQKREFFEEKKWNRWNGYAYLFGMCLWISEKLFGKNAPRVATGLFGITVFCLSIWIGLIGLSYH